MNVIPIRPPASPWESRKNNFDALRIFLALLVLASHCWPLATGTESSEPVACLTHGQLTGGAIAVDLFFAISGFMIAASMQRSASAAQFLRRRFTRIYPGFFVCALISFLVVAPLAHAVLLSNLVHRAGDFLLQTLRLREFTYTAAFATNPFPGHAINGSVWSIQYEFWCYIGVLLLGITGMLARRTVPLLAFAASVVISLLFLTKGWIFGGKFLGVLLGSPQLWARLLPYYLAGVVFYLYRDRIPHRLSLAVTSVLLLVVAAVVPHGVAALFPMTGTYLAFYIAYAPWLRLHNTARFGDFSYGLYLYAFPLQQLIMQRVGHPLAPWKLFVIAAPLTLIAAILSWYLVERRFLRAGRQHETLAHAVAAG